MLDIRRVTRTSAIVVAGSLALVPLSAYGQGAAPPRVVVVEPAPKLGIADQVGLETLAIQFSAPVTIPAGAVTVWTVAQGTVPAFGSSYDVSTSVLTLEFDPPVANDLVTIVLDYAITGLNGLPLDGEIVDPAAAALPSGDGQPGGQAVFRINVLQGDANRDGIVDDLDGKRVAQALGTCAGDGTFDAPADLNRDGCVNVLDVAIWQNGVGLVLPKTDGTAPTITSRDPTAGTEIRAESFELVTVVLSEPLSPGLVDPRTLFSLRTDGVVQPATNVVSNIDPNTGATTLSYEFSPALEVGGLHRLQLSHAVADASGELLSPLTQRIWNVTLDNLPTPIAFTSPFDGEQDVALTRETVV
ncbi:MAG: hypothetical protein H6816_16030, partial [Phycisphaerales bacterium]|nr:hypothetical protein [Phycisphaerales bacterium]